MMTAKFTIRETTAEDFEQILALYPQAFPKEDLTPVVSALLKGKHQILSLAGFDGEALVAHVLFTICGREEQDQTGALLAPLGVVPSHQQQGLGDLLVRAGLERLKKQNIWQVFVLGDPNYYKRFGFLPERQVLTPYPIPEKWADAWQSVALEKHPSLAAGSLLLPEPWMDPALWGP